jgi:hypothetical protein
VVLAVRELAKRPAPDDTARDMAAFIALALSEISNTIDASVVAWEKRGYWVKADRFRMEWNWTVKYGNALRQALLSNDWTTIALLSTQVAQKLNKITISPGNRIGMPWVGAWQVLKKGM